METPEETLIYILNHVTDYQKSNLSIQHWFGDRLIEGFDDWFMVSLFLRDATNEVRVPTAVVIDNDAYIYASQALFALIRDSQGRWKLSLALSMCWGCFGDHSDPSGGTCWGVLCQCCGGTGWENGDLDFCAAHPLPDELEVCVVTDSPRVAFLRLLETDLPILSVLKNEPTADISLALVRGDIAKLEIITAKSRYLALMQLEIPNAWCLTAFVSLCAVCGGRGINPQDGKQFCSACGGLKWGSAGELRYCRNPVDWSLEDWFTAAKDQE